MLEQIELAGSPLSLGGVDDFFELALERHQRGVATTELSMNALKLVNGVEDPSSLAALHSVDVVGCDGVPVRWLAKAALGRETPRMNGTDLMDRLLDESSTRGWGVYLLGSTNETLARMTELMTTKHPGARVVGVTNGFEQMDDLDEVSTKVRQSKADVVLVALPSPMKEVVIASHAQDFGPAIIVAVGGSFEVYIDEVPRAPVWMQRAGLEWFHRFALEPKRLGRRYTVGNLKFLRLAGREIWKQRIAKA